VSEELYRRLRVDWGYRESAPVVEGVALAVDLDRQPLTVLGVDPFAEGRFRDQLGPSARGGRAIAGLLGERSVVVGATLAERYALAPGAEIRLLVEGRLRTLRVAGVVRRPLGAADPLAGLLLMDVGAAQELLGLEGSLSRVDLVLTDSQRSALEARLPPGLRLVPASEQAATLVQLADAFQLNLSALSLLALVVGMFLIYNTVLFGVVRRRGVFGTLRALGATPAQVFALVLVETAAASALGSLLGLGLGWLLGQGALRLVTRTINDLYFVLSATQAPLTLAAGVKALAFGIGAALASALPPALEAARVEPVAALRRGELESRARSRAPKVALAGLAMGALGAALLVLPASLPLSFAGLFAVVLALALVTPAATLALMAGAGPAAARLVGPIGRIAARTVASQVARTGVAIAALMVAVSVTVGVSLMIQSFRATVADWLDHTLRADLYLAAPRPGRAAPAPSLAPELRARVAALPGVADVETLRTVEVASPEGPVELTVAAPRRERSRALYRAAQGSPAETWKRVEQGAVLVSEPFAFRRRVPPRGGSVTLRTDRGPRVFPVAGIYYDYASERGAVLMARGVYERHWEDRRLSSLAVYVSPGASADDVAARLRAALAGEGLHVAPTGELRQAAFRIFDRTFAVTDALRVLAVVVAFVGVWSALMALQAERTRELATLQALGLTPARLSGLTLLESGLMGLVAGLMSLPTGTLLALILVEVINVRSFGWTMRLALEPAAFVQAVLLAVGAALLATLYPLFRLSRLPVAAALRSE
jgi:putative ABC transport system permease protein